MIELSCITMLKGKTNKFKRFNNFFYVLKSVYDT